MTSYHLLFKGKTAKKDGATSVSPDGKETNSLLHHEMTDGVEYPNDDCIKAAVKAGMNPETAKRIWG